MKILGKTLFADLSECESLKKYSNVSDIENLMMKIAAKRRLNVVSSNFHKFSGGGEGISGMLILAESHIAIHTYPEYNYVSVDIFLCDLSIDIKQIMFDFVSFFKAGKYTYSLKDRTVEA